MDFHPIFFQKNDQNRPHPESRALNPIRTYLKVLTTIFWLLNRASYVYRPAELEKKRHLFAKFRWIFTILFQKNNQNRPHTDPRALNPMAIAYLKALLLIFWLLMRVSYVYGPAGSEK